MHIWIRLLAVLIAALAMWAAITTLNTLVALSQDPASTLTMGLRLIAYAFAGVLGLRWAIYKPAKSVAPISQKRLDEKSTVANEQALLKIDALEAKIKTLEVALSKALTP
jgi:hypothetical protein